MINVFRPVMATDEILNKLRSIMNKGWIGLGPETKKFEKEFSKYVGSRYAIGTNSATSALHLSLIVSGIKEGDEVITTPMTFVSTNHAILYQRAIPIFCDIDPITMHIDCNKIEELITEKTKAIMVVHYAGFPVNMEKIAQIAEKYDLWIIEDAAHAAGSIYNGNYRVGSNYCWKKTITCFSFHAVKNIPTQDSGMITVNNKEIKDRLVKLRWCGIDKDTYVRTDSGDNKGYNWAYNVEELGYKYHMNDVAAVIGHYQLFYLEAQNLYRRTLCYRYRKFLDKNNKVNFVGEIETENRISSCHMCVIMVDNRNELLKKLNENDIFPGVHYFPNHMYECYKDYYRSLPIAEKYWNKLITLPLHIELNYKDVDKVCEVINSGW